MLKFTREFTFKLNGIDDEFKLFVNQFSIKLFKNKTLLKKKGGGFKGIVFDVENSNGDMDTVLIRGNGIKPITVVHNNEEIQLERNLTPLEIFFSFIPLIIMVLGIFLIGGMGGLLGGILIGLAVGTSILSGAGFLRENKSMSTKLIYEIIIGVVLYIVYFLISFSLSAMIGVGVSTLF